MKPDATFPSARQPVPLAPPESRGQPQRNQMVPLSSPSETTLPRRDSARQKDSSQVRSGPTAPAELVVRALQILEEEKELWGERHEGGRKREAPRERS